MKKGLILGLVACLVMLSVNAEAGHWVVERVETVVSYSAQKIRPRKAARAAKYEAKAERAARRSGMLGESDCSGAPVLRAVVVERVRYSRSCDN